jgi:hypothetical protein
MATINAVTDIATMLAVYAFKSVPVYAADLPPRNLFTLNFDESIGTVGQQVVTRIPFTLFGSTANNLANGWGNLQPSSSNVTATLQAKGYDHVFNVVTWDTVGESQLLNTFANILQKQTANNLFVDVANLVTASVYTHYCSVSSSSQFNLTGALFTTPGTGNTGLQSVGTLMDELELTQVDRYALLAPTAYQGLISNIFQTYVLGNDRAVVGNGFVAGTEKNQAWPGIDVAGFDVFKHPRINPNTATVPLGGATYSGTQTLAGWAGIPAGIVLAARPMEIAPSPLMAAISVVDPTSGFPLTYMLAFDTSLPGWRLGVYSLYGVAAANTNAIVPIVSATT